MIQVIGLDDRASWNAAAAAHGLPDHGWHYAWGLAASGHEPQLAIIRTGGGETLLPFLERGWRGSTDIATLPGLSGIWPDPAALTTWRGYAIARGWVCGYLQLAAEIGDDPARIGDLPGEVTSHNALFILDMASWTLETLVSRNTRKTLKTGQRAGAELVTDQAHLSEAFFDLHRQTLARSGASPAFTTETLTRWFADPDAVAFGAALDGRIEAVQLGRARGLRAELHLAGASDAGRPLQAWLIWQAAEALRAAGHRWVNIGGYGAEGDGLHAMKRRFGATEYPLRSLHQIYDRAAYDRLCAEAGCDPDTAYFPAYRAG